MQQGCNDYVDVLLDIPLRGRFHELKNAFTGAIASIRMIQGKLIDCMVTSEPSVNFYETLESVNKLAYEAMNALGDQRSRLVAIVNRYCFAIQPLLKELGSISDEMGFLIEIYLRQAENCRRIIGELLRGDVSQVVDLNTLVD